MQKIFADDFDPIGLPELTVILIPHWKYALKQYSTCCYHMCCNRSTNTAHQLYAVAYTWSSCVKLPVQRIFVKI